MNTENLESIYQKSSYTVKQYYSRTMGKSNGIFRS